MHTVILETTLVCPACGRQAQETVPADASLYFYECGGCGASLRPVYCSHGSMPCLK
ncbi:GDCCVxC domain-containing (seleno)protein [Salinisphaera dokdonensis]|uniref:GDCCVxC domain-containing (seleno)protein n=1 Tax=Salinisphaera dokdonensis TaxID=454598 RepID=UPI0033409D34